MKKKQFNLILKLLFLYSALCCSISEKAKIYIYK